MSNMKKKRKKNINKQECNQRIDFLVIVRGVLQSSNYKLFCSPGPTYIAVAGFTENSKRRKDNYSLWNVTHITLIMLKEF